MHAVGMRGAGRPIGTLSHYDSQSVIGTAFICHNAEHLLTQDMQVR